MNKPLILHGTVRMWENEGGFAEPGIEIGDEDLGRAILRWAIPDFKGGTRGGDLPGTTGTWHGPRVRITVELIDAHTAAAASTCCCSRPSR